jgi:hypothetical protein
MVCSNIVQKKLDQYEIQRRIELLGISKERAEFLLACPIRQMNKSFEESVGNHEACIAQLKEAARLGISLKMTAKMMDWTIENTRDVAEAYGIQFPKTTTVNCYGRSTILCLMLPYTEDELLKRETRRTNFLLMKTNKLIKIVAVGDNHGDMVDAESFNAVKEFIKDYKPDVRVHLGDCFDFRSLASRSRERCRVCGKP